MKNTVPRLLLVTIVCLVAAPSELPAAEPQPLFADQQTLHVRIDAPLSDIQRERDSDDYHDGTLAYIDDAGVEHVLDVKLRARGKFRRQRDICPFPPIRLNFRKQQVDGTVFAGQDKLKLVTHCRTGSARYEQHLLREMIAYRLFQVLTEQSFSVRLLRISWNDSSDDQERFEQYGFVIEDEDRLGDRLGTQVTDAEYSFPSQLDPAQATLVGVFQYLIGNTDFSMLRGPEGNDCCHNVTLYDHGHGYLPVPYDFDSSGIVNAPYAEPNARYKIPRVTARVYLGRCQHNERLDETLRQVAGARQALLEVVRTQEGLEPGTARSVTRYIEGFFKDVADAGDVEKNLVKECV